MWTDYSTRDAAEFVGLPESAVRSCVRAGFVIPNLTPVPLRFSFRHLTVLKKVKALVDGGIPLRRVRRQLRALQRRLGDETSLAEVVVGGYGGHVVVRDGERMWRADTGQLVFEFDREDEGGEIRAMPVRRVAVGPDPVVALTADEWFERGVELEEVDTPAAIAAYRRALRLRPDCSESWINLGRLHAETGDAESAVECFEHALKLDPSDATAIYNLGVVAQDEGKDDEAIELYKKALGLEVGLAEAHYNLATLFDRRGDVQSAIRHINEYRKLTRGQRPGDY